MLINKIQEILEAEFINDIKSRNKDINTVFGSDLMSDVLTFVKPGALLLTGLTSLQVVRTAEMAEIVAICFVRGKKPSAETLKLAGENNIPLLITRFSMYEACGKLYQKGLSG